MSDLRWTSIGAGLALAVGLALLARASAGPAAPAGGALAAEFAAVLLGALLAARLAGQAGVGHGLAVAIGYIVVATAIQGWAELEQATAQGPDSLPPLDLVGLILGDLVHLSAGFLGGWLARTGGLRA